MPMYILPVGWYRNQTMQVKWGTCLSYSFTVTNGARQDGGCSPYFFTVYLAELSVQLGTARARFTVGYRGCIVSPYLSICHWVVELQIILASVCGVVLFLRSGIGRGSAIFVQPQQWPTPSESIAIYCVRKLVSCITHLQSCAKVDIWNKKKRLRTVAKIKPQGYKTWRLPKFSTSVTLPLNTATALFNEPRSQRPSGTSDWQNYSSRLAWLSSQAKYTKLVSLRNKLR